MTLATAQYNEQCAMYEAYWFHGFKETEIKVQESQGSQNSQERVPEEGNGERERESTLEVCRGVPLSLGLNTELHSHKRKIIKIRERTTRKQQANQLPELGLFLVLTSQSRKILQCTGPWVESSEGHCLNNGAKSALD